MDNQENQAKHKNSASLGDVLLRLEYRSMEISFSSKYRNIPQLFCPRVADPEKQFRRERIRPIPEEVEETKFAMFKVHKKICKDQRLQDKYSMFEVFQTKYSRVCESLLVGD